MACPPLTLAVSDAVALGIAALFRNSTRSGVVTAYFVPTGAIDSSPGLG